MTTPAPGPTEPAGRPRRSLLIVLTLALLAGSLLTGGLLAELLVRLAAPQQLILVRPDIWQPADSVGWLTRPNVRTRVNTGERTVDYYTDGQGFRVGAAGPEPAGSQVLLIGDSFMQALQVQQEHTLAARLGAQLSAALGRPVAVRNAGVDGWDPPQYLIRARSLLARDRWDAVVVMLFTGNDVVGRPVPYFPPRQANATRRLHRPRGLSWAAVVDAWLYPANDWLDGHSHLFIFLKRRLAMLRMRLGLTAETFPPEFLRSRATAGAWDVTADICAELAAVGAAHGVPVVFGIIPTHYQVNRAAFTQYAIGFGLDTAQVSLDQPSRLLAERLRARNLVVVDLLDGLREAFDGGIRPYGEVDFHFSPAGHELAATLLRPAVLTALDRRPARRGGAARHPAGAASVD